MKILYIIHDCKKGGAQVSFLDMLGSIAKHQEVVVLTPHKKGYVVEQLEEMDIEHFSFPYYWWEVAPSESRPNSVVRYCMYRCLNCYNRLAARILSVAISKYNIDIIHSNSSVINIGAMISERTGIKHVWHLRELGKEDFGLVNVSCVDEALILNQGSTIYIAISRYVKDYYSQFVDKDKIEIIYNGISDKYNIQKYDSSDENDRCAKVTFLISGRFTDGKGQMLVLEAINDLVQCGVVSFKVFFAGGGDSTKVEEYIAKNHLDEYSYICGMVEDMNRVRKECDVEIVASKCEAFGRVTIEAMRSSNPVIGANSGGTVELIDDGENGFLFECGNSHDLAMKMRQFIDNPLLCVSMGKQAYDSSVDKYTSRENAKQIMMLYDRLLV